MHNGVGLPTPKGSGSSGYTQSNKFVPRPKRSPPAPDPQASGERDSAGGREEILEHERKRQIYLRELIRLEQALIDRGFGKSDHPA